MSVPSVGGSDLSQLARLYRQQVVQGAREAETARAVGAGADAAATAQQARGTDFASAVGDGLKQLEALDRTAVDRATRAATGDLADVHDYVIAATRAQTATELTTTVRNKALEAFNEIMRMPL